MCGRIGSPVAPTPAEIKQARLEEKKDNVRCGLIAGGFIAVAALSVGIGFIAESGSRQPRELKAIAPLCECPVVSASSPVPNLRK